MFSIAPGRLNNSRRLTVVRMPDDMRCSVQADRNLGRVGEVGEFATGRAAADAFCQCAPWSVDRAKRSGEAAPQAMQIFP
jgi:hypothetical protein